MTSSLYSSGELSLMISTGTGNSAGKDLSSLGHALSELIDILVIYLFCSVYAEHTNLLAASLYRSGTSFHVQSS